MKVIYSSWHLVLALFFFSALACKKEQAVNTIAPVTEETSLDFKQIAAKIIEQSDLQQGERVLLVMAPGAFNPIIPVLRDLIEERQGRYLGTVSVTSETPPEWQTKFTLHCQDKSLEELENILQEVDLGLMLPGAHSNHLPYKALQNILTDGSRRTIHFHWAGAYDLNGKLLETDPAIAQFYQEVLLNTDYAALAARQDAFENTLRNQTIRVTTPAGTDIQFEIGDRPVTKQDGDASATRALKASNLIDREIELPSGAIRVAPIENSVNGTIAFPDAEWDSASANNLIVTIEAGKIVLFTADQGMDAVERELEKAGAGGRSFREFALGFNPLMPIQEEPAPWIPYYGYGAGIVRLSLGDNTELGGQVGGGYVRWNFFTDATVYVGNDKWVENGKLIR